MVRESSLVKFLSILGTLRSTTQLDINLDLFSLFFFTIF